MHLVHSEVRVMPVEERVIEADAQAVGTERVHHRGENVTAVRRVRRLVVGVGGIPEAEALVMLGRDDEILHPGVPRRLRPELRIVEIGIEVLEILRVVDFRGDPFVVLQPFVACAEGVEAPVDEHAEPVMGEPACVARRRRRFGDSQIFQSHKYLRDRGFVSGC